MVTRVEREMAARSPGAPRRWPSPRSRGPPANKNKAEAADHAGFSLERPFHTHHIIRYSFVTRHVDNTQVVRRIPAARVRK